ncbi:MAG: diguanylate cyclase [Deltaproteobacteria bacterium]|nr:diguanylate cyclase [Deltaproteobacteria bacterium]
MGEQELVIWLPAESARLRPVVDALCADGHALASDGPHAPCLALVDAARAGPQATFARLDATEGNRGRSPFVAVLADEPELGARWLQEGADEYASTPAELLARVRARLQRGRATSGGAIPLPIAAELALAEAERTLAARAVELVVLGGRGGQRCFVRAGGRAIESNEPDPELPKVALGPPGVRIFTAGVEAPPAIVRRLNGAEAVAVLGLYHDGESLGAVVATLGELPTPAHLEAFGALGPALGNAVRGAVSLEEAFLGRFRDLLESNRRLRELNHAKDEFLAVCVHDLRSPLTALLSHATLLGAGARGALPVPARASVDAMLRQARTMEELIHSLLAQRALETGTLELQRVSTDPAVLLAECVEAALPAAQARGVELIAEGLLQGPQPIEVDAPRLREAVGNLLANAVKYTPAGGQVVLDLKQDALGTTVVIADNGPGIAPDELPHLFQRYRRGRSGRAVGGGGVGLGLSWAREVLRLHGGTISVQSALGQGTRFTIRLPLRGGERDVEATTERPRVLVVEDDRDVREVTLELMRDRFEVICAEDGEDGVRLARTERPDVVLMDLFMPRLDGFAALEDLRRDPRTVETPVIFLSGSGDEQVKLRVLGLGAADYLVKPFSPRELLARVEKALEATRQRRAAAALAQVDALTGLPNYGAFRTRLDEELKRAARYHTPLSAVMIDLDRLKQLNDAHGHEAGNRAIVALADHVRSNLRGSDFAARFGGDEFVVLLPHTRAEEAAIFAERVRAGLGQLRLPHGGERVSLHASFGVCALPADGVTGPEEALRGADEALYAAKRAGRDRVCVAGVDAADGAANAMPA